MMFNLNQLLLLLSLISVSAFAMDPPGKESSPSSPSSPSAAADLDQILESIFSIKIDQSERLKPEDTIDQILQAKSMLVSSTREDKSEKMELVGKLWDLCQINPRRCANEKDLKEYDAFLAKHLWPEKNWQAKPEERVQASNGYHCLRNCREMQLEVCTDRLDESVSRLFEMLSESNENKLNAIWGHFSAHSEEEESVMIIHGSLDAIEEDPIKLARLAAQEELFFRRYNENVIEPCTILADSLGERSSEYMSGGKKYGNLPVKPQTVAWLELTEICKQIVSDLDAQRELVIEEALSRRTGAAPRRASRFFSCFGRGSSSADQ